MQKNLLLSSLLTVIIITSLLSSSSIADIFLSKEINHINHNNKTTNSKVIEILQQINKPLIKNYLEELIEFGPRNHGSQGIHGASEYISEQFKRMGLQVRVQDWNDFGDRFHFGYYRGTNIEGTLAGTNATSSKTIVFNAHYDTVENTVGADDDGSGVVAVLAAAFVLSQYTFEHTIKFVTVSGEEVGLLGSNAYAREAFDENEDIILELNADMIGHAKEEGSEKRFRIYGTEDIEYILDEIESLNVESNIMFNFTRGSLSGRRGGSDYYSFVKYGFESIAFFESEWNEHMHSPEDDINNVNLDYLVNTTRLIVGTIANVADNETLLPLATFNTPKRGRFYLNNNEIYEYDDQKTVIIGDYTITIKDNAPNQQFTKIKFYYNDELLFTDMEPPFEYTLTERGIGKKDLKIIAYKDNTAISTDLMEILYLNIF